LPNTSLHHLDFYDRVNFARLRENRQAGKNLPGFVLAESRRLHGDRTSLAQAIDIPISDLITLNNSA